jgi:hypothetical protein
LIEKYFYKYKKGLAILQFLSGECFDAEYMKKPPGGALKLLLFE